MHENKGKETINKLISHRISKYGEVEPHLAEISKDNHRASLQNFKNNKLQSIDINDFEETKIKTIQREVNKPLIN